MAFTKITIYTNTEGIEPVTGRLYQLGIQGVQITDSADFAEFMQNNLRAWDVVDEDLAAAMASCETTVETYLSEEEDIDRWLSDITESMKELSALGDFGRLRVEKSLVRDEDWMNNWKQFYKPLRIGERILVKPSWEEAEVRENDVLIELDPGMAFGTGSHASTHMCLEYLEKIIKPGDTVLDIGTGSGILAIAALKLGAKSVTAVDIDPLAVKIAVENGKKNGVCAPEYSVSQGDLVHDVTGTYDVVIANIVADIIIELCADVSRYMKDGGCLLTSGIICHRADDVKAAIEGAGLTVESSKEKNDWHAMYCKK